MPDSAIPGAPFDPLPDVARNDRPLRHTPLAWVGMEGIAVPVRLDDPAFPAALIGHADAAVDLPDPRVKGIHMSRLHRLVATTCEAGPLTPAALNALLADMVASHHDCGSTAARVIVRTRLLRARPALVTPGLSGWQDYPLTLIAERRDGVTTLSLRTEVVYSSTCPCSAALVRQVVREAFVQHFDGAPLTLAAAADWLSAHATLATPHSQRSVADVTVTLGGDGTGTAPLAIGHWLERMESALGTPVQTAVKRADEQAFARLNGSHLMYVEDAARAVEAACRADPDVISAQVSVRHLESLHPHDAVATADYRAAA
jgi:GTP cyclohydrolase I